MIRILGIDPGSQRTGIGVIDVAADGKSTHVFHTTINLLDNDSFHMRLRQAFEAVGEVIEEHGPTHVAIERVSGSLSGRTGTFVLQHSGLLTRGAQELTIRVVPDSAPGELGGKLWGAGRAHR